jgi:hypothetical protein
MLSLITVGESTFTFPHPRIDKYNGTLFHTCRRLLPCIHSYCHPLIVPLSYRLGWISEIRDTPYEADYSHY